MKTISIVVFHTGLNCCIDYLSTYEYLNSWMKHLNILLDPEIKDFLCTLRPFNFPGSNNWDGWENLKCHGIISNEFSVSCRLRIATISQLLYKEDIRVKVTIIRRGGKGCCGREPCWLAEGVIAFGTYWSAIWLILSTDIRKGLEYLSNEDRLRELGLLSLEKAPGWP